MILFPSVPQHSLTLESFVRSVLQGVSPQLHERPQNSGFFQVFFVHFEFDLQEGEQTFQTIIQVDYAWQGLEFLFLNCNSCVNLSTFFLLFLNLTNDSNIAFFTFFQCINVDYVLYRKNIRFFLQVNETSFFEVFHDAFCFFMLFGFTLHKKNCFFHFW